MTETIKQNPFLKWANKRLDKFLSDDNPFEKVPQEHNKTGYLYPLIPQRQTKGSAGFDLHISPRFSISPQETKLLFTDVRCKLKDDEVLLLFIRSSVGTKHQIALANGTGVIDSDYYDNPDNGGNIGLALYNYGNETVFFEPGTRIAQGVIVKFKDYGQPVTERTGGFGSSGK